MNKYYKIAYYLALLLMVILVSNEINNNHKMIRQQKQEIVKLEGDLAYTRGMIDSMNFKMEMEKGEYGRP